jgi:hypothetical protein
MSKHRHPDASVSKNPALHNFNPADALERLYAEMIQVEAFAHAAGEAMVQLRCPSSRTERRAFNRIYTLVTKAAAEASTALRHGDELISALSAHLQARRARGELDPRPSVA